MKPLVIFGAGGLGREFLNWIVASPLEFQTKWHVTAFVSDDASPGDRCAGLPVLRRTDFPVPPRYLLAIGSVAVRRRISEELNQLGWEAVTWVHDRALVTRDAEVGEGSHVLPFDVLSAGVRFGRFVLSNGQNVFGHDVSIGDYSVILGRAWFGGDVVVGSNVLIGACAVIHPRLKIGDGATIGIGSVVVRNVPPGETVFGNPAKRLIRRAVS